MRAEMYRVHHEFQNSHWWFTARREIVIESMRRMIRRDPTLRPPLRLFDVGCGAGGMLPFLREFGTAIGVDPSPEAAEYARANGHELWPGGLPHDLQRRPAEPPADVVLLLDVLEHIDDDGGALAAIRRFLRPGGALVITVPACPFLWSGHDVVNEHRRRYTKRELARRLTAAGFVIEGISYYNTALFPAIAGVRLLGRLLPARPPQPHMKHVPHPLNRLLHHVFAAERRLVPEVPLPFGVSLIATARSLPIQASPQ